MRRSTSFYPGFYTHIPAQSNTSQLLITLHHEPFLSQDRPPYTAVPCLSLAFSATQYLVHPIPFAYPGSPHFFRYIYRYQPFTTNHSSCCLMTLHRLLYTVTPLRWRSALPESRHPPKVVGFAEAVLFWTVSVSQVIDLL